MTDANKDDLGIDPGDTMAYEEAWPSLTSCPVCESDKFYKKDVDYSFFAVTASNKDELKIEPGATAAYNIHLAKNTTFY